MSRVTARTIERKVADAMLQRQVASVTLRGKEYPVGHPSPATLIMVSQYCSELPEIDPKGNVLREVIRTAWECGNIGKVLATLILGAKRISENRMVDILAGGLRGRLFRRKKKVPELDYVAAILLEDLSPSQLSKLATDLFFYAEVSDFFGLTTSLSVANLLKSTKEVGTASGG